MLPKVQIKIIDSLLNVTILTDINNDKYLQQTDIIRILLRNGAAVEAKARERQTPLHIASRLGNVDIAVLLLQHGADVRAMTADHYNPLHIAAKQHNHDVSISML